jgi:hypothetical protein
LVVAGKDIFILGFFQILIGGKGGGTEDFFFVSLLGNVPALEQKKQPSNKKLHQEVEVIVTRNNHAAISENAGTKGFTLT